MIKLVKPSKQYEEDMFRYKQEMIEQGDSGLPGCGGLDKKDNYEDWIRVIESYSDKTNLPENYVEGSQWFLVDGGRILGMVNIRHYLNDFLTGFGGHIGYSIRPSERRKGYATYQLRKALDYLKTLNVDRVLVTCDDDNIGSQKTIEACGGVLEDIRISEEHGRVRRYWIDNRVS